MSENLNQASQDAREQIAQLREQVQTLMNERVSPALANARDTAQQYAQQARDAASQYAQTASQYAQQAKDIYEDQSEILSERVREAPIMAILIAAGVGYLLGRIAR